MERYFFDYLEDKRLLADTEGVLLPDIEAARREGARALAELAAEVIDRQQDARISIEMRASDGATVGRMSFDLRFG